MKKPGQRVVMIATALAVCWYLSNNSLHSGRAEIEVASANAFPAKVTAMEKKMRMKRGERSPWMVDFV